MKKSLTVSDLDRLRSQGGRVVEWIGMRGKTVVNYVLPSGKPQTAELHLVESEARDDRDLPA